MDDATKGNISKEDEIDALLGQALEEERLCVSEELIQKTLRQIKDGTESKISSMQKPYKKWKRVLEYSCAAAAAVFVLMVGGSVFAGGFLSQKSKGIDMALEARDSDEKVNNAEENTGYTYATVADQAEVGTRLDDFFENIYDDEPASAGESEDAEKCPEAAEEGCAEKTYLGATKQQVSEKLQTAFAKAGFVLTDATVECFELVRRQTDWDEELVELLDIQEQEVFLLPQKGAYAYFLTRENGEQCLLPSEEPLDLLVRVETTAGGLWCLFGETVRLYTE